LIKKLWTNKNCKWLITKEKNQEKLKLDIRTVRTGNMIEYKTGKFNNKIMKNRYIVCTYNSMLKLG